MQVYMMYGLLMRVSVSECGDSNSQQCIHRWTESGIYSVDEMAQSFPQLKF
ncbi:hypothetical protein Mapa_007993 [Marchantia paleacea]|nr:hypothetical protein Mapa_007993 [Marchantia paleacea]